MRETSCLEFGIDQATVLKNVEHAAFTYLEIEPIETFASQIIRQTDGFRLVVSHAAVVYFDGHCNPPPPFYHGSIHRQTS